MEQYRIGEFAKNLCVSQDLLKHYEKYNILQPTMRGENGYRYYSFRQAPRIMFSKQLQNWGFSLKEISRILKGIDSSTYLALLEEKRKEMNSQHREISFHLKSLDHLCSMAELVEKEQFDKQWLIQPCPSYFFLPHSRGFNFINSKSRMEEWINIQGISLQAALITSPSEGEVKIIHGIALPQDYTDVLSEESLKNALVFEGRRSLICYRSLLEEQGIAEENFIDRTLDFPRKLAEDHNFGLSENSLVLTYFHTQKEGKRYWHRVIINSLKS